MITRGGQFKVNWIDSELFFDETLPILFFSPLVGNVDQILSWAERVQSLRLGKQKALILGSQSGIMIS